MAASSQELESKDPINEVIPTSLINIIPKGVTGHICDYVSDVSPDWLKERPALCTFFGTSFLQKQILALVDHAGPLNQVEDYIRKAHARGEAHLSTTLRQAINRAIIGLDQTIRDKNGAEIDKGIAERLLELYKELFPATYPQALKQARLAAPLEKEEEKQAREKKNVDAVNKVFEAIKQNDEKTAAAIEKFKDFIGSTKPEVITTNSYYLNLMHLVFVAFNVVTEIGWTLPRIQGDSLGGAFGPLGDRFCFEIIGATIEKELPARMRQILMGELHNILRRTKKADRILDIDGRAYLEEPKSNDQLGVHFYYDYFGVCKANHGYITHCRGGDMYVQELLQGYYLSVQNLLYSEAACSFIELMSDNVEIQRSLTVTSAAS